jgi:hypothetical protein
MACLRRRWARTRPARGMVAASTLRTRDWRGRQVDGQAILEVRVTDIDEVGLALTTLGLLDAKLTDDHAALSQGVERAGRGWYP